MTDVKIPINRTWVGLFAVICLAGAATIWLYFDSDHWSQGLFVKLGLITGAMSIAIPWRGWRKPWIHVSPKTLLFALTVLVAVSFYRYVAIPVIIVFLVVWFMLRPRKEKTPNPQPK